MLACRSYTRLDTGSLNILIRLLILILLLVSCMVLSILLGDVSIDAETTLRTLLSPGQSSGDFHDIIWQVRLPRVLIALVVGAALSVSGYILQVLTRNTLADPYLTGVSSGACVCVALAVALGLNFDLVPFAGLAGGLIASVIVAYVARSHDYQGLSVTRLLLAGVVLSTFLIALTSLVIFLSGNPVLAQGLLYWLAGGISGKSWAEFWPGMIYTVIGIIGAFFLSKQLRLLSLGKDYAASLGAPVAKIQWSCLLVAVLLCGAAVALSGLVGFVGLIAPHLSRQLFDHDERLQIFTCAVIGGILVMLSDLCARMLIPSQELPLGTLLSLLGGFFFLTLMARDKGEITIK